MNTASILSLNDEVAETIREALSKENEVKVLKVVYSSNICPTIGIDISFDAREVWPNGIYQNSRHMMFMLHADGRLVSLCGYKVGKFRACKVKDGEEAARKLIRWVKEKALNG